MGTIGEKMRRLVWIAVAMGMFASPIWAAEYVRLDIAALAATEGPTSGIALGADVPFGDWAYSLRVSRAADSSSSAVNLTAGLEYELAYASRVTPYIGARAGARFAEEDVTVCVTPPKKGHYGKPSAPVCRDSEVETDGFLYQAALGLNIRGSKRFGATAEAAYNGGEGEGVEFLVGVTIRP